MNRKLSDLITQIDYLQIIGNLDINVSAVVFDSRKVEYENLFVATKGVTSDGHDFISNAVQSGASAIVCENIPTQLEQHVTYIQVQNSSVALAQLACEWYNHPSRDFILVGVTGTNGKTTIATLLYETFKELGYKVGLLSTVCNYINGIRIEATHTTPDALSLNQLMDQMRNEGCKYVFMEVSSHAVDQGRVVGLDFDGGVFTNITRDHIDYHVTFENYIKAKKTFFDGLSSKAFALTNLDDKNGNVMLQNSNANKYTYSLRSLADFKTKILEHGFEGMLLDMNNKEVHVQFIGKFNASNISAVYGASILLNQDEMEVLRIISKLTSVSGRFQTIHAPQGYTAIVDYAHTPDALNNVITTINEILQGNGRLITVVGCGGNRDKGKRPMMATEAVNGSWKTIFTSDNPRDEDPEKIILDMTTGLDPVQRANCVSIVDRKEAIRTACMLAQQGDIILVAGKGHEDYQIVKGVKYHFDDREVLK